MMHSNVAVVAFCACFLGSLEMRVCAGDARHYFLRSNKLESKTSVRVSRSLEQHDNIFDISDQRREAAANDTQFLSIQPSITACQCNGVTCETEEKHVGESIRICLWSNFLPIDSVANMTLHAHGVSYKPVVDGVVNELTELSVHGRLAVVTTMIISAFFDHATSPSDVVVDATVLFGGDDRRHLTAATNSSTLGSKTRLAHFKQMNASDFTVICICLSISIVGLYAVSGRLLTKRFRRRQSELCMATGRSLDAKKKWTLKMSFVWEATKATA